MDQPSHPPEPDPGEITAVRARDAATSRLRRVNVVIAGAAVALTGAFVALAAAAPIGRASHRRDAATPAAPTQGAQTPSSGNGSDDGSGQGFSDPDGSGQGFDDNGGGFGAPSQAPSSGSGSLPVAPSGGS